jgi:DNA-binding transcriptional ArsR family regulator
METADPVFKAIAHPIRRAIISLLAVSARSVKELTSEFNVSQPAISQHLRELKNADLVSCCRIGVSQLYNLTPKPLKYVGKWLDKYRTLFDPAGHAWTLVPMTGNKRKSRLMKRGRHGS